MPLQRTGLRPPLIGRNVRRTGLRLTRKTNMSSHTEAVRGISPAQLLRCDELAASRGYLGPQGTSWVRDDARFRQVRNERWQRPSTETFDEFLVVHLKNVLGREWGKRQVELPPGERHVVVRWMFDAVEQQKADLPEDHRPGQLFCAEPSGSALELLTLAEDVYRLSLKKKLPRRILRRLRAPDSFQGARYEIAVAAAFARAGFSISWLDEKSTKHGEFTMTVDGGETIVVEAKSRHRPDTLHQPGDKDDPERMRADVIGLYAKALKKETRGLPLLICIDVNLPLSERRPNSLPRWADDVRPALEARPPTSASPAKEFCLVFTNFNWHYCGLDRARSGNWIYTFAEWTECAPTADQTYAGILQAFDHNVSRPEGPY